jgi:hypothetical protein
MWVQFTACKECKCFLQTRCLDGTLECAACGSQNLGKREIEVRDGRPMPKKERCIYCDKEAGHLCRYGVPLILPVRGQ